MMNKKLLRLPFFVLALSILLASSAFAADDSLSTATYNLSTIQADKILPSFSVPVINIQIFQPINLNIKNSASLVGDITSNAPVTVSTYDYVPVAVTIPTIVTKNGDSTQANTILQTALKRINEAFARWNAAMTSFFKK